MSRSSLSFRPVTTLVRPVTTLVRSVNPSGV